MHPIRWNSPGLDLRSLYSTAQGWVWTACALLGVGVDFWLVYQGLAFSWVRALLPMVALVFLEEQMRKHPQGHWFQHQPHGGWVCWFKRGLVWGGVLLSVVLGVAWLAPDLVVKTFPAVEWSQALWLIFPTCVLAPLLEEGVYRLYLCTALATKWSPFLVVFSSGALFSLLHLLYGSWNPANCFAGFLLAWVYCQSASYWVPVLWHAAGNLLVLALEVGFIPRLVG